MSFAVEPEALAVTAALTAQDAGGVDEALHLVAAAARQARDALAPGSARLLPAVVGYLQVESAAAAALGQAGRLLATGLADAGSRYATAEGYVSASLSGGRP